jgi:nudix-type nucleoside diphosphatase (YffH/AdpP family)
VNGHTDGMLIEVAAGLLDEDDPVTAIQREAAEETGFVIGPPREVMAPFMSPGSVTERVHLFCAPYSHDSRVGHGGGVAGEGEDIEVLELPFAEALAMVRDGTIADAKTILLLQWAALTGLFDD